MSLPDDNEDVRAAKIFAVLDAEEAKGAAETQPVAEIPAEQPQVTVEETAKPGPEEIPATVQEQGQSEPAEPAIEPPKFLKAEYRTKWSELSPDWQRYLAQQEEENRRTVSTKLDEAAAIGRAAEAAQKAAEQRAADAAQEQQRYAQTLATLSQQVATLDPVIAQYRSTDLVKLAKENPGEYAALDAAYKQRAGYLEALQAEQTNAYNAARQSIYERENQALVTKVPEWADPEVGPKQLSEVRNGAMKHYGYSPQEVQVVADHRMVLMARDAIAYHALKAKVDADAAKQAEVTRQTQQAIAAKKIVPVNPVLKPGASNDVRENTQSERSKALMKQARGAKGLSDKAALIAEALGD